MRERIGNVPGVDAVGGINALPLAAEGPYLTTVIEEFPPAFARPSSRWTPTCL